MTPFVFRRVVRARGSHPPGAAPGHSAQCRGGNPYYPSVEASSCRGPRCRVIRAGKLAATFRRVRRLPVAVANRALWVLKRCCDEDDQPGGAGRRRSPRHPGSMPDSIKGRLERTVPEKPDRLARRWASSSSSSARCRPRIGGREPPGMCATIAGRLRWTDNGSRASQVGPSRLRGKRIQAFGSRPVDTEACTK
jgi:hypothetical protein